MRLPLEGITVIDAALQYPGPYCTQILSDLGADVVKIEPPGMGDPTRMASAFFNSLNRNKKSIQLNLKDEEGVAILKRLVEEADVFIEGFRPGVTKRLGVDYATFRELNGRLIYCSISGFGQDGPYKLLPGHDVNYQAMAGMLQRLKDENGNCIAPEMAIGDLSSGMFATIGIMAALMARQFSGKGQLVDVSMFDGLISWMGKDLNMFHQMGLKEMHLDPGYGVFQTKDGRHVSLGIAYEDWFWKDLCRVMGLERYKDMSFLDRRNRHEQITRQLKDKFRENTLEEWLDAFKASDVPIAPVKEIEEVVNDPHVKARKLIDIKDLAEGESTLLVNFPVKFSDMAPKPDVFVSKVGEHGRMILEQMGYAKEVIESLEEKKIV